MGILEETIHELIEAIIAGDKEKQEKTLKLLEKSGMDRRTALVAAKAVYTEEHA